MTQASESNARLGEVLDAAASFYSEYLWTTELGEAIRVRIAREGVEEETIRSFDVGYIPGEHGLLEDHLTRLGFSAAELYEAGLATRSHRGRTHSQFRSRVMFPIRDVDGRTLGFAGMATNPGPSWPLWVISPDRGRFDKRTAIFAIDRAATAIGDAGRAVVFRDCLDVLRAHQGGRREAVALIRCSIMPEHVAQIATALGEPPTAITVERREDAAGTMIRPAPDKGRGGDHRALGGKSEVRERVRSSDTELRADPVKIRTPAQRVFVQVARAALGLGIPMAWLAIVQPDLDAAGGADPAFVGALGGVAGTYVILAIASAIAAARIRARSRARRMRAAWQMGATEWQPLAWTYHMLEDILIGAAIASSVACAVLFVAVGGFTN